MKILSNLELGSLNLRSKRSRVCKKSTIFTQNLDLKTDNHFYFIDFDNFFIISKPKLVPLFISFTQNNSL